MGESPPRGGQALTTHEYFAKNDSLAREYKTAKPSRRTAIVGELYTLDLPTFQAWRLRPDEREDFRSEACLYLVRALETYKPDKGPFINWLRNYVKKTFTSHSKQRDLAHDEIGETLAAPQEEREDSLFWSRAKELCSEAEWKLVEMRFRDGLGIGEIAKELGVYPEKIRRPLVNALDKIKSASLQTSTNPHLSPKNLSELDPTESAWLKRKDVCRRLGLTVEHIKDLLNPKRDKRHSPCMIDPRDVVRFPSLRIRFLETSEGLLYPRIIRRGSVVRRAGDRGGV